MTKNYIEFSRAWKKLSISSITIVLTYIQRLAAHADFQPFMACLRCLLSMYEAYRR